MSTIRSQRRGPMRERSRRAANVSGLAIAFAALFWGGLAHAQSAVGVDFGLYFDNGTRTDDERIGPSHEVERDEVTNARIASVSAHYLHALSDEPLHGFRLGGELVYRGERAYRDNDDRRSAMGTVLELGFRGDWTAVVAPSLGLTLGMRVSLAVLFVGGELEDEITRLSDEGVSVGTGPRLGVVLIPSFGLRYALLERLHLRFDLGVGWSYLDGLDLDERVQGVDYTRTLSVSGTRIEVGLGAEITF